LKYGRYKVTKTADGAGKIEVFINKTMDIRVVTSYVTLPAYTSNVVRDVSLERTDGTILGEEKAAYKTSEACSLVFSDSFMLPHFDPLLVVDTRTVSANSDITLEIIYEEVEMV